MKLQSDARACDRLFAPRIRSLARLVYLTSFCRFVPLRALTAFPQVFDMRVRSSTTRLHILELLFMLTSRLARSSHLSLLPWKNGLDSHSPRAAYHLWYVPISLCTDNISSTQKRVDAPVGRQEDIVIFAGHQRGAWTNNLPTGSRLRTLSNWVCLIFYPSVVLIRKYFSIHTPIYLSNGHLTHQTLVLSHPPGHHHYSMFPASNRSTNFSPTFITLLVARCLDLAAHGIIQENYSHANLLR